MACVLQYTLNLVIPHGCFGEDAKEMYQDSCRTIVPVIKSFVWRRPRYRCRRSLPKLPNCTRITYKGAKLLMASFSIFLS